MTEAYLTMTDLSEISTLMSTLGRFKDGRYALEVVVSDKNSNKPIGRLKQNSKGGAFVFVPAASAYVPYKPTDRGE